MFTIDRIERLCAHYGYRRTDSESLHQVFDALDEATGIDTTGGLGRKLFTPAYSPVNPVGARLALHEEHLALMIDAVARHG